REIPGQSVEASFVPISRNSNQVRLVITARRNRADFGVALSHRPTPLLGDTQVNADLSLNGWLRGGDRLGLALSTSAQNDLFRYYGLSYSTPVGHNGWRAALNLSSLTTEPDIAPTQGTANSAAFVVSYPLLRSVMRNTTVSFGVDALDTENSVFGQALDSSRTRVLRSSLSHSRQNNRRAIAGTASFSLGLDSLGARVDPLTGDADFMKLTGQGSWTRVLTERALLRVRTQAQISGDRLPTSERFALGGEQYGRAFASGLVQGDQGIAASAEAAYRPRLQFAPRLAGSEAYAFVDGGTVWVRERTLSPSTDESLSSYGAGVRISLGRSLSMGIEIARPIDSPATDTEDDDWRLTYSIRARDAR
ncbi:MAG TPA: ShlB/FhaC/HecB family hemolysin secretion/activation protein, partial [Verrucomicrobiae bacterium]|nr:ShlB/FhaC/HecB family hemolysin secretion/activation protein [Verrucomicrobiae bacterium]